MYSTKPESRGYHASLSNDEMGRLISALVVGKLGDMRMQKSTGMGEGRGGGGYRVGSLEGLVGN